MSIERILVTDEELPTLDAYWRAANYLAVGRSTCSTTLSSACRCTRST
jgi:phosphoketolase